MKMTMRVTKYILITAFVTTMNVALAETETEAKEPTSDIFAEMFKHHFSKDFSFAVGTKLWIHDWQTSAAQTVEAELNFTTSELIPLPASRGFVASRTSNDTEVTPIPVASLRYKNLFVIASHYQDTDFDFPEITFVRAAVDPSSVDAFDVAPSFLITDRLSANRLEWDAALGYFLHPYVALTAGYKFIKQDFTSTVTVTFPASAALGGTATTPPSIIKSKTEISGPFVGLIASVPIGRGFGVYGNFAYGFLESEFFNAQGEETRDAQSQPYILAEGGFTYTYGAAYLPAWMPLSAATVYAGYRYQDFDTETDSNFNGEEARDVTKGFAVGVNLSF